MFTWHGLCNKMMMIIINYNKLPLNYLNNDNVAFIVTVSVLCSSCCSSSCSSCCWWLLCFLCLLLLLFVRVNCHSRGACINLLTDTETSVLRQISMQQWASPFTAGDNQINSIQLKYWIQLSNRHRSLKFAKECKFSNDITAKFSNNV